jgi:quercetin dioxygenase-like cupin family protein
MTITHFQEALPMPEKERAMLPLIDVKDDTKLVLVALPAGLDIAPHKAPYPASVQLLTGRIEALKGKTWIPVVPGERVVFDQDELHSVKALEPSYLLVTHMRGQAKP